MNLYISANDYDYHTLVKASQMAGLYGIVGFHEAGEDYLPSFSDGNNTQARVFYRFFPCFRLDDKKPALD